MKKIIIPDWLKKILDDSGLEQGRYSFVEDVVVELEGLPTGYVGIAVGEGGGLAVSKKSDGVVYRLEEGKVDVYAVDNKEFLLAVRRDEAWEALSENMPATEAVGLGLVLTNENADGQVMTLGFPGPSRDSALVLQATLRANEMLTDALDRELAELLDIHDYEVMDVVDEDGVIEVDGVSAPLFTIVVGVTDFDPVIIGDARVGWIMHTAEKVVH